MATDDKTLPDGGSLSRDAVQAAIDQLSSEIGASSATTVTGIRKAAAGDDVLSSGVTGDATDRFSIDADGKMTWGDGTSALSVPTLSRNTSDSLYLNASTTLVKQLGNPFGPGGTHQWGSGSFTIKADGATGVKIGLATTEKVGFFNATPVVQQAAITAPAATAATITTPYGYTTQAQADAIVTAVRAIITELQALGLTA